MTSTAGETSGSRSASPGRADILALVLAGAVAAVAVLRITPDTARPPKTPAMSVRPVARRLASSSRACPLTPQQEQKAVDLFHDKLMPVLMHPRCFNCHGGVDVSTESGGHLGGVVDRSKLEVCRDCHGLLQGWSLPPEEMMWIGKSERALCVLFKQMETSPAKFVGHVTNENMPNAPDVHVAERAFIGDAALNALGEVTYEEKTGQPFKPDPAPGSHQQLIADSREWANTIGAGWKVFPDCGCKPSGTAWEGTVKATWTLRKADVGVLTEKSTSTVRLELDTTMIVAGDPTRYWHSVSGAIRWSITMTGGECTSSEAGTVPVGIGGDLNPMATVQTIPKPNGTTEYEVAIGPWPDAYNPQVTWKCTRGPRSRPGMAYQVFNWWQTPFHSTLSPDGKTMKGSYNTSTGVGDSSFEWELHLVK